MAEKKENNNFVDTVVNINRVTKVTKGGKRFSFSALVITGTRDGKVGIAIGKSREVSLAIAKATSKARKHMIEIPLRGTTIPYDVTGHHGSSRVVLRAAAKGTGVIAGSATRAIMEALGIKDILAKSLGSANRQNVAKATLNALAKLRTVQQLAKQRGMSVKDLIGASNVKA